MNTHNFVKNDLKLENKSLFDVIFYGAWHEKIFRSQISDISSLEPKNYFRLFWAQTFWERTYQVISWEP